MDTRSLQPAANNNNDEVERMLYAVRQKIFPRAVHGWFANWRVFFVLLTQIIYYGLPWLTWNGRQAVLFDLVNRKFYIFDWVFFPQDFIWLTGLLIISAYSLFLFTAIAGRLWCGFACPQTVYTEIFLWVERKLEGDRLKQMKLDKQRLECGKDSAPGQQTSDLDPHRILDRLHLRRLFHPHSDFGF